MSRLGQIDKRYRFGLLGLMQREMQLRVIDFQTSLGSAKRCLPKERRAGHRAQRPPWKNEEPIWEFDLCGFASLDFRTNPQVRFNSPRGFGSSTMCQLLESEIQKSLVIRHNSQMLLSDAESSIEASVNNARQPD